MLRLRHAEQADRLAVVGYQHRPDDPIYHLIDDVDFRQTYGELIGRIAYSHWWPAKDLISHFNKKIGAFPGGPPDWVIDPLKLALIVRTADACHLDSRRAPGFLRTLRKPVEEAEKHWRFQGYVQMPHVAEGRLIFTSPNEFDLNETDSWWLGYEMLNLADDELREADAILRDTGRQSFAVDSVAGAHDPIRLSRHIPTKGWTPIPTKIQVGDVPSLVRNLGGHGLYGENPRVPLRELIQNARDAVVARRLKQERNKSWGDIIVRLVSLDDGDKIQGDCTISYDPNSTCSRYESSQPAASRLFLTPTFRS